MLKKLLGLMMVAALNVMPNTIFAAGAPVGDGQEEVHGGGGTAGAADDLAAHGLPEQVVEEDPCAICFRHLGDLVEDEDNRTVALHPVAKTQETQHRFHRNCIRRWLQYRHNCPLCNEIIDNAGRLRLGLERLTQEQEGLHEQLIDLDEELDLNLIEPLIIFCAALIMLYKPYVTLSGIMIAALYYQLPRVFICAAFIMVLAIYAPYVLSALMTAALYYLLPTARSKKEMLRNIMAATAFFMLVVCVFD